QGFRVEAVSLTGIAQDFDIGQKVHLYGAHSLAAALGTPAIARIEGKARGSPAAYLRITRAGKKTPDVIPEPDIGRRARAGRLANGRLVHFQYPINGVPPLDAITAHPGDGLPAIDHPGQIVEQYFACQRGFAGSGHPRDHAQACRGDLYINVPEIMPVRPPYA